MPNRKQMLSARRRELLDKGYPPGIVNKSLDWAVGCADGMASYASEDGPSGRLANQFLAKYLDDAEKFILAFGHKPTKS